LKLTAWQGGQIAGESSVYLIYLGGNLRPGWPQHLPIEGDYSTNDWRAVTVADLERDGFAELIRVDQGNSDGRPARLLVFGHDGKERWSRVLASGEPYSDVPVAGDVDQDGYLELFVDVGSPGTLFAFRHDGTPLGGNWPLHLEASDLGKVLADLDGDGRLELVAFAQNPVRRGSTDYQQLLVFDGSGGLRRSWYVPSCEESLDAPEMFPAVGNLDENPDLEIVVVSGGSSIAAYSLRQPDGPLWRGGTEGALFGSPAIGDVDHDGRNEIVIGAYDLRAGSKGGTRGGLYLFDSNGQVRRGWPVLVQESFAATPALADVNGDGLLEISIPSWSSQKLHLVQANGFEAAPWPLGPFNRTVVRSGPVIGDVDGDGRMDVAMVSPGQFLLTATAGDLSAVGGVRAWRWDGSLIDLNPHPELPSLVMESGGGSTRLKAWPVTLTDLDGNGKLDVVAASIDDPAYSPEPPRTGRKRRYSLYTWELDTPYDPANLVWPTFQHDAQHTGYLPPPPLVTEPPVTADIPDQTIKVGSAFFLIELDQYVEDPDTPVGQLSWTVEGNRELQVSLGADRVARVQTPDANWVGQETLRFLVRDPAGHTSEDSATFTTKLDYDPPIAQEDRVQTMEDQAVEIAPLANDSDPHGYELRVIALSKPQRGKVELAAQRTVLYTPGPDFEGADSFTYLLSNGKDGMAMGSVDVEVLPVQDAPVAAADHAITTENMSLTVDLLENDRDPDGDALVVTSVGSPENGTAQTAGQGVVVYRPNTNFHGMDHFPYRIADGQGGVSEAEVTVMVKPVNLAPVAQDLSFSLNRNTHQDLTFLATDPNGDELTFQVLAGPEHGALWNYPKVATYYPAKGFAGADKFTYQASDGELVSQIATVSFNVLDRNNPPVPESQSLTVRTNRARTFRLLATDADDDPLTFELVRPPMHGTVQPSGTNYLYQPQPDYLGEDRLAFRVSDGQSQSAEASVNIKVTDQNSAPLAKDSSVEVKLNATTLISPNGEDIEGDPLTYLVLTSPLHGRLEGQPPNLLYHPDPNYVGPDRFTFKASDGELESQVATVTIAVRFPNHAPEANDQSLTLRRDEPSVLRLAVEDLEGDFLRAAILKGPAGGRISGLGTNLAYTPKPGFTGKDSFTYKVWDGHIYSQVVKVSLYVTAVIPPVSPSFQNIEATADQVTLTLKTPAGKLLRFQASTNLWDWTTVFEVTPPSEEATFVDTNTATIPARFYRAILP
jgi:hypothetical protein